MAEELEGTLFEYTYMYDQFSVFFYGDRVFIGKKDYPIGQCCLGTHIRFAGLPGSEDGRAM